MDTVTATIVSAKLTIDNPAGLHARPAALFVQTAANFGAAVRVRNLTRGTPFVDAKSILGIMTIGVKKGHDIEVEAAGDDAEEAIQALSALVANNFGE